MPPRTPSAGPEHAPCVSCGSPRVLNTQPRSHAQCMQAHAWCMPSGEVSLRTFASSLALCCSFCNAICSRYFSLSNASAYLPLPACGTGRDCAPPSLFIPTKEFRSLHFCPPSPRGWAPQCAATLAYALVRLAGSPRLVTSLDLRLHCIHRPHACRVHAHGRPPRRAVLAAALVAARGSPLHRSLLRSQRRCRGRTANTLHAPASPRRSLAVALHRAAH